MATIPTVEAPAEVGGGDKVLCRCSICENHTPGGRWVTKKTRGKHGALVRCTCKSCVKKDPGGKLVTHESRQEHLLRVGAEAEAEGPQLPAVVDATDVEEGRSQLRPTASPHPSEITTEKEANPSEVKIPRGFGTRLKALERAGFADTHENVLALQRFKNSKDALSKAKAYLETLKKGELPKLSPRTATSGERTRRVVEKRLAVLERDGGGDSPATPDPALANAGTRTSVTVTPTPAPTPTPTPTPTPAPAPAPGQSTPFRPTLRRKFLTVRTLPRPLPYNPSYLSLLNTHIASTASPHLFPIHGRQHLEDTVYLETVWTAEEKEVFFKSVARRGKRDFEGIRGDVGSKSLLEIATYVDLLESGLRAVREGRLGRRARDLIKMSDIPVAVEVSELWLRAEMRAARKMEEFERGWGGRRERRVWGEGWGVIGWEEARRAEGVYKEKGEDGDKGRVHETESVDLGEESGAEEDDVVDPPNCFEAELLKIPTILKLAESIYMNPLDPRFPPTTWSNPTEGPRRLIDASLQHSTLTYLEAIAKDLTRRLVEKAMFVAAARCKNEEGPLFKRSRVVRYKDVRVAVEMEGLGRGNLDEYWVEMPERLGMVVKGKHNVIVEGDALKEVLRGSAERRRRKRRGQMGRDGEDGSSSEEDGNESIFRGIGAGPRSRSPSLGASSEGEEDEDIVLTEDRIELPPESHVYGQAEVDTSDALASSESEADADADADEEDNPGEDERMLGASDVEDGPASSVKEKGDKVKLTEGEIAKAWLENVEGGIEGVKEAKHMNFPRYLGQEEREHLEDLFLEAHDKWKSMVEERRLWEILKKGDPRVNQPLDDLAPRPSPRPPPLELPEPKCVLPYRFLGGQMLYRGRFAAEKERLPTVYAEWEMEPPNNMDELVSAVKNQKRLDELEKQFQRVQTPSLQIRLLNKIAYQRKRLLSSDDDTSDGGMHMRKKRMAQRPSEWSRVGYVPMEEIEIEGPPPEVVSSSDEDYSEA
ncbi:hypothetical protein SAICODRAFT_148762 [Saitoella complicata NRRL Y-17804]|uniref:uncharacterized protein n=1 Tax=Saitoella complicata (strain BCRC 22490 / CBS 7301 / JCM 7358 / NBRC 10748 / NRRL Y-17804) TaxID=698492 RepID=UPI000867CB73|nr:uncharacterized protein SAICODRAFT_148762 [Saitoella complicata NRRL Y-17804]ODQ55594.1 hypothetical protein SAICODRAFT_148762 [Saitoella complicata NRRL Y-17804]